MSCCEVFVLLDLVVLSPKYQNFGKNLKFYFYKFWYFGLIDQHTEAFLARFFSEYRDEPAGLWRPEKNRLGPRRTFFMSSPVSNSN
jgi:hypothetical protein